MTTQFDDTYTKRINLLHHQWFELPPAHSILVLLLCVFMSQRLCGRDKGRYFSMRCLCISEVNPRLWSSRVSLYALGKYQAIPQDEQQQQAPHMPLQHPRHTLVLENGVVMAVVFPCSILHLLLHISLLKLNLRLSVRQISFT